MNSPLHSRVSAGSNDIAVGSLQKNHPRAALFLPVFCVLWLSTVEGWARENVTVSDLAPLPEITKYCESDKDKSTACTRSFVLEDSFDRADTPRLGPPWSDCKSLEPDYFEPLGIYDGGIVIADTDSRPGTYDTTPPSAHPPTQGRNFRGIGCAFIDTGSTRVSVTATWSGHRGIEGGPPHSHVEGTPLLYVTPGVSRFAFGAWPSELWGRGVIFAGYIASPPENFEVLATALLDEKLEPGTPVVLELRAEEPGKVTVWVNGMQADFNEGYGLKPFEIDPDLTNSTLHGFAVDAHYVDPVSAIPHIKSIEDISIRALDAIPASRPGQELQAEPAAKAAGF